MSFLSNRATGIIFLIRICLSILILNLFKIFSLWQSIILQAVCVFPLCSGVARILVWGVDSVIIWYINDIIDRAINGNVIMVACTLKHTVQANESSQYDCFRKPASRLNWIKER